MHTQNNLNTCTYTEVIPHNISRTKTTVQRGPTYQQTRICYTYPSIGWLRLVGSIKLSVSFAKEPYKRDYILQKIPVI